MNWIDIACLTFAAVCANHLGLIKAIEGVIKHRLPIVSCDKCLTFWLVLVFCICGGCEAVRSVSVSFLSAYVATWLRLLMAFIDKLYNSIYDKIYPTTDTAADGAEHT